MPIVQGDRIDGANGTWECEIDHGARPESIKIRFTPKGSVRCTNIRLVQQVKAFGLDKDGKRIAKANGELYKNPADNPFGWEEPDSVPNPGGIPVYVDHSKCEGDPYYNGDDPQDASSRGDGTTRPPKPTEMSDGPSVDFDNKKAEIVEIHKNFETCAICAETGEILGCIWWSSISTRRNPGQIAVHTGSHDEPASGTMKKALKKFIQRHVRRGADGKLHWFCPETGTERGLVPGGFDKALLAVRGARLARGAEPGGELVRSNERLIAITRPGAGEGRTGAQREVIERALRQPQRAAIKFTWSGEQEKTIPGVIFSAFSELTPGQIAPFVSDDSRFANDFVAIRVVPVEPDPMKKLLTEARTAVARAHPDRGPVTVSVIAGLGTASPIGWTGTLEEREVRNFVARARRRVAAPEAIDALNYVALNMGRATEV